MNTGDIEPLATCERCQARRGYIVKRPDGRVLCQQCWQEFALHAIEQALEATRPRPEAPPGSHYDFLRIPLDATYAEIEAALARRVADLDRGFDQKTMQRLKGAESDLTDSKRKDRYDRELRQQLAQQAISPIEDFHGARVVSIADLVTFCDASEANWRQAQRLLADDPDFFAFWLRDQDKAVTANIRTLLDAVREEQKTFHSQDSNVESSNQPALSDREPAWLGTRRNAGSSPRPTPTVQPDYVSGAFFRRLNELLYVLYPDRSYRLFQAIDRYDQLSFKRRIASPTDLPAFADASGENWALVRLHLYQGLLPQWLEGSYMWRYREGNYRNQRIMTMRAFLDQVCLPLRGSQEDLGVESLLEFIDRSLPWPRIQLTINGQVNGFEGKDIDPEDRTLALSIQVENVSRGYCQVEVSPHVKSPLTARLDMVPHVASYRDTASIGARFLDNDDYSDDNDRHPNNRVSLRQAESKTMRLQIQQLQMLNFGSTVQAEITVRQGFPEGTESLPASPVTLHMAAYRSGPRLNLIDRGLRGGRRGFALHATTAFIGVLLVLALAWAMSLQNVFSWPAITQSSIAGISALFGVMLLFGIEGSLLAAGKGYTNFSADIDATTHKLVSAVFVVIAFALEALLPLYSTLPGVANGFLAAIAFGGIAWVINSRRQRRYRASGSA